MKNKGELIKIGISALITILLIGLTVIKPSQGAGGFDVSDCISMSEEEIEDFISEQNLERNELFDEMMEGEPDSGYVSYQNEELSLMLNDAGTIELINILYGTTYDFAGVKLGDDYLDGNTTVSKLQEAGYALDEYLETTAFWMRDGGTWLLRLDMDENDIITEISLYRAEETEYGSSEMAEPEDASSEISEPEDALPSDADMENVETSAAIAETEALEEEYVIPGSDSRYLTDADVEGLDLDQIRLAINEIYARHGRAFQTEDLNEYFSSKSWYTPLYSADGFAAIEDSVMNDYEKENIKFLAAIRDRANRETQALDGESMTMEVVNCNESITLREAPDTSAAEICQIPLGAYVEATDNTGTGFTYVLYTEPRVQGVPLEFAGYVLSEYLAPAY